MSGRGCKHTGSGVMHHGWHAQDGYWYEAPYLTRYQADAAICLDCGAWLSLGPSNDRGVEHEIKLAAHIQEVCVLWEPKDQGELIGRYIDGFASQATHKEPKQ